MTRVSKQKLQKQMELQLFSQFVDLFAVGNRRTHEQLFMALFSDTEKIMFTKRLAVVLLLFEEYSTYAIAKTLHVSDSTVREVRMQCEAGRYDVILSLVRKKTFNRERFWKILETLLQAGLPPHGRGRWKWLYEKH